MKWKRATIQKYLMKLDPYLILRNKETDKKVHELLGVLLPLYAEYKWNFDVIKNKTYLRRQ